MFRLIEGLPEDVLGLEAVGKVTHADYHDILIPRATELMAKGPIKMLYAIGEDFDGYQLEALWDDGRFGVSHWRDFKRIAVVADLPWIRAAVSLFRPLFPCEVKLFSIAEFAAAKEWIAA
jgi:hypothetical protein